MHSASPRAITRLLLVQLFFNCTQIHAITYTNHHQSHSANYTWTKGDSVIHPSDHYLYVSSALIIVNLTKLDGGRYQCQQFDSQQGTITIRVVNVVVKGIHM